MNEKTNKQ